ncbi:hypothetical protein BTQ07_09905 [Escherichia coli]|uniref:Uncharacterized protein n=1 Tax=Escherichia coli TaxID=562 RepID=A0A1U9TZI6_ECOLX|nr:hypothetical protein BE932_24815 [Escherichia coli]KDV65509.1 hypothetical protein BU64_24215 [Escherichia coli O128:H2 str. 2011C-3317]EFN8184514.1 hypothetical protein [Escherichia coli]PAU12833.1 hypothetical protein BTQ06_26010 [Escherichia coli]PAU28860.1 hypothetical protein BTQ07_09905 [Escherichia coli]
MDAADNATIDRNCEIVVIFIQTEFYCNAWSGMVGYIKDEKRAKCPLNRSQFGIRKTRYQ